MNGFRSTPEDTEELRQEMGLRQRGGEMDVEIWTSGSSIYFPLRIKASTKNFTPKESLTLIYSDIGEVVHLSVPEEVLNINYFDRLMVGDLDTAEVGQLVRALPVQGQNCVEEEVGIDLYRELVAGVGQADLSVQDAFLACNKAIFPVSLDHLKGAIPEYLPFRHLSAFSVTRDS